MTTVEQVLHAKSGQVLATREDAPVYDALAQLAQHDIGALVVLDRGRLIGMFSERDYARKVILHGKSSKDLLVADVMTRRVHSVAPCDTIEQCMALMTEAHIRHLPVVRDDAVVGMISIGDVVKATLDEQRYTIAVLEQYITT
jgi:CBS domain-containing protein